MNGDEVESWSGLNDWEESEYDLPAGSNLIRFTFKKNADGTAGEDAVMVDNLRFPPFSKMVLYAGNDTEICSNQTFTTEGYIYYHTEFEWTTNGDGTFDDATLEHPTYTFGPTDISGGQVALTLTGISALDGSQQSSTIAVSLLESFAPDYAPEIPVGAAQVDLRLETQSEFEAEAAEDVIYTWTLEPAEAGTLSEVGSHALVVWNDGYRGEVKLKYAFENTCGATSVSEPLTINVFNSTGTDEHQACAVEVYPNPAKNMIQVKTPFEGEATLRIVDLWGRVVYEREMQHSECEIETSKFGGSGLYMLQVIQNNAATNARVMVLP